MFPSIDMIKFPNALRSVMEVERFVHGPPGAIVIVGPPGSGKVTLATQAVLSAGRRVNVMHQQVEITSSNLKAWEFKLCS